MNHIGELGKKRRVGHDAFVEARARATDLISRDHIDRLTLYTRKHFRQALDTLKLKKAAVAFSGGKDSLVVRHLFPDLPYFWVRCDLEYPAFERFMEGTGCDTINTGQDIEWLVAHPEFLFPRESNQAAKWFSQVQWAGQTQYFKRNALDVLIVGRRIQDGNRMGRHNEDVYTNQFDVTRFAPIWEWTHEEVFAYLAYHDIALPPCYDWPDGFVVATGPWPKRRAENDRQGWGHVYRIDPDVVINAASRIPSAAAYLEGLIESVYPARNGQAGG